MNFYLKILPGLFFILIACEKNVKLSNDSIYNISPTKILEIYNKQNIALIDVRTEGEYRYGHIPNSKLIPLEKLHQAMSEIEKMKEKKIIICCRTGRKSLIVTQFLRDQGFDALNMIKGIMMWDGPISK